MKSIATTIDQYIGEVPEERRQTIQLIRDTILENLPCGYDEVMNWGMITYQVPLAVYPDT